MEVLPILCPDSSEVLEVRPVPVGPLFGGGAAVHWPLVRCGRASHSEHDDGKTERDPQREGATDRDKRAQTGL